MERIQELTEKQDKQIEQIAEKHYQGSLKAVSLLKLLKVYYHTGDNLHEGKTLNTIEPEVVIDIILEELTPLQSFLGEVSCDAGYILEEKA